MNKKYLFSIMLSIMFLISPMTQADIISAPSYQVDVTHQINDAGKSGVVAAAVTVRSTKTMQSVANIKLETADLANKVSQHNSHKSITVTGIVGVSGGGSIGIGKPS